MLLAFGLPSQRIKFEPTPFGLVNSISSVSEGYRLRQPAQSVGISNSGALARTTLRPVIYIYLALSAPSYSALLLSYILSVVNLSPLTDLPC